MTLPLGESLADNLLRPRLQRNRKRLGYFFGWLRKMNVPFLLPTMMSAMPSLLRSTAVTCVPTPESSSILWGMNRTPCSLSRCNSNQ